MHEAPPILKTSESQHLNVLMVFVHFKVYNTIYQHDVMLTASFKENFRLKFSLAGI